MRLASAVSQRIASSVEAEWLGTYGVYVLNGQDGAQHRSREHRPGLQGRVALAIGMDIDAGLLSLETTVSVMLPEMQLRTAIDQVMVGHLVAMNSGIGFQGLVIVEGPGADRGQEILARPSRVAWGEAPIDGDGQMAWRGPGSLWRLDGK
ncbi:hypothetical protein ACTXOR_05575 [Arthrobacter rhombi]|uniref:hypothetical protein n=2 Tax=Arthrobacter rhombi TaxID=71253 RepID=UPI003FD361B8